MIRSALALLLAVGGCGASGSSDATHGASPPKNRGEVAERAEEADTGAPEDEAEAPPATTTTTEECAGLRYESRALEVLPAGAVHRRHGRVAFVWDAEGATYFEISDEIWAVWVEGAEPGARVFPIRELDTVRWDTTPPDGFALVRPGADRVCVVDFMGSEPMALPLERAGEPVEGEPVDGALDEGALGATLFLRAMRTCPRSRARCALYGAPAAVAAAQDPVRPPHGLTLVEDAPDAMPDGPTEQVEVSTEIEGVGVVFTKAPGGACRVALRVDEAIHESFVTRSTASRPNTLALAARAEHLYVFDDDGRYAVHERASGARVGQGGAARWTPYFDTTLGEAGEVAVSPVFDGASGRHAIVVAGEDRPWVLVDEGRRRVVARSEPADERARSWLRPRGDRFEEEWADVTLEVPMAATQGNDR